MVRHRCDGDDLAGAERDLRPAAAAEDAGKFVRQTENCLACHGESMTHDVPGLLVRSTFCDADGMPILSAGTFLTTQESPLSERWGGWYVSGVNGTKAGMAN